MYGPRPRFPLGLLQPGPPSSLTGRPWGINLTAKCCRGQSHVPGGDLKPLPLTTPTVCRHQNLEQGQDLGGSPRDRPPGSEHTQGSASHQERLRREGPVVQTSLLDRPPPQPPTTPEGHGHRLRGPRTHALGSAGATPSPGRCDCYQNASGLRSGTDGGLGVEASGLTPLCLPCLLGTRHSSVSWAQRRPWRCGAFGAERPCGEPRSVSALEGGSGDVRFPADALGTCPLGASAGCVLGAPFTPHKAVEIPLRFPALSEATKRN